MWEGVGDRTELQHIDPHSIGHNRVFFPFSWVAQPGAWGPASLGAGFRYRILSLTRLIPNWLNLLRWFVSYIIVQRPPSTCGRHNFALIQPVHGKGYNILIFLDGMHLLFIQVNFLFWQPGWVGGQYATLLYSKKSHFYCYKRIFLRMQIVFFLSS